MLNKTRKNGNADMSHSNENHEEKITSIGDALNNLTVDAKKRNKKRGKKGTCLQCGKKFFGRKDKVFCHYNCRNKYYYETGSTLNPRKEKSYKVTAPWQKKAVKTKYTAKNKTPHSAVAKDFLIIANVKNEQKAKALITIIKGLFPDSNPFIINSSKL